MSSMLENFEKHPDVAKAAHVGDPPLVDPEPMTATAVVRQMTNAASGGGGDNKVTVEMTNGKPAPNEEAPRSDAPAATATAEAKPAAADPNELKPNVEADPNALPPLQQSNQLEGGSSSASSAPAKTEEMADISSSKKKKKKGLKKLNPF
jgi:outer membrane protein assembly factor BamD